MDFFFSKHALGAYYKITTIYIDPLSTTLLEFYPIVFCSNSKMGTNLTRQNDTILIHNPATVQTQKKL